MNSKLILKKRWSHKQNQRTIVVEAQFLIEMRMQAQILDQIQNQFCKIKLRNSTMNENSMSKKQKNRQKSNEMKHKKSLSIIESHHKAMNESFSKLKNGKSKLKKRSKKSITNFAKCTKTFRLHSKILMHASRKLNQIIPSNKITIFQILICQVFQTFMKNQTDSSVETLIELKQLPHFYNFQTLKLQKIDQLSLISIVMLQFLLNTGPDKDKKQTLKLTFQEQ